MLLLKTTNSHISKDKLKITACVEKISVALADCISLSAMQPAALSFVFKPYSKHAIGTGLRLQTEVTLLLIVLAVRLLLAFNLMCFAALDRF